MLEVRTMMRNAESMVLDLQDDNLADGPQIFIRNDPKSKSRQVHEEVSHRRASSVLECPRR